MHTGKYDGMLFEDEQGALYLTWIDEGNKHYTVLIVGPTRSDDDIGQSAWAEDRIDIWIEDQILWSVPDQSRFNVRLRECAECELDMEAWIDDYICLSCRGQQEV